MKQPIRASLFALLAIFLGGTLPAQHVYRTTGFSLEINGKGQVIVMNDLKNQINYVPAGNPGYLVRIKSNGKDLAPSSVKVQKNLFYLTFEGGVELQVAASQNTDYLKFELKKVLKPEMIEAVLWGPFTTTINETIGEMVGVVRNKDFAIGIQTLNPKTNGGRILNDEGSGGEFNTASKEDFGAALQANCMNHALNRVITVWNNHKNTPVGAIKGYTLEESAIALFGTTPADESAMIVRIEVAEKLHHPMIDGQWIKTSNVTGKPYLIASFS